MRPRARARRLLTVVFAWSSLHVQGREELVGLHHTFFARRHDSCPGFRFFRLGGQSNMATALCSRTPTCGPTRAPRCASIACPPHFLEGSSRVGQRCGASSAREGVSQRGRALEAACLDQVDFGGAHTTALLGRNAAVLMLRRNEVKDQRKRWGIGMLQGELSADSAKASSALAAKLAERQPSMARIVQRAQHVKETTEYQGTGKADAPSSKRVRSRGTKA